MKTVRLNRDQIQQLIKEEFSRANRKPSRGLKEAKSQLRVPGEVYDIDALYMLRFARAYAKLGGAVQDQLHEILDDPDTNVNSNAVAMIEETMSGMNHDIDFAIKKWKRNNSEEPMPGEPDEDGYYEDGTRAPGK